MDLGLEGARCIVTGASSGIGAATVRSLAREGAVVGLVARRRDALEEVAAEARATGARQASVATADLRDPGALTAAFVALTDSMGGVDVLVNNAGSSVTGRLEDVDDAAWQDTVDLKLMGYVRAMRFVLPLMRAQRSGVIVNVLGTAGTQPSAHYVLSCVVSALAQLTASVADEMAAHNVRVVGISPGYTRTERLLAGLRARAADEGTDVDAFADRIGAQAVPLGRLATANEMGDLIAFLASERASFVTGTQLLADGGLSRAL